MARKITRIEAARMRATNATRHGLWLLNRLTAAMATAGAALVSFGDAVAGVRPRST